MKIIFSRAVEQHGLHGLPPRCSLLAVPNDREIKIRPRSLIWSTEVDIRQPGLPSISISTIHEALGLPTN